MEPEVVVVGAGPAGMTTRAGVSCLVLSQDIGGQAAWGPEIQNYLGYWLISGVELINKFYEHLSTFPAVKQEFAQVTRVDQEGLPDKEGITMAQAEKKLTIFTLPTCPDCIQAKRWLTAKGISFEERSVDNPQHLEELRTKYHRMAVPTIVVDGQVLVGFTNNRAKLMELLGVSD